MRKEILVAIVLGIFFGCIAAYGIWKAKAAISAKEDPASENISQIPQQQNTATPTVVPTSSHTSSFSIVEPKDNAVFAESLLTVSGNAAVGSVILTSTLDMDYISHVDSNGAFTVPLALVQGPNFLSFNKFENGKKEVFKRTVVYSSDLVKGTSLVAYLGSVTDKTENSLQIKNSKSEILFVSVPSQETVVSRITENSQKTATYDDVAIGDYVVALGEVEPNDVLNAKRIILTTPAGGSDTLAVSGTITEATKLAVSVKTEDGLEYSVKPAKTITVTEGVDKTKQVFADLELDQNVIVSGTQDGPVITARRIHVL